MIKICSLTFTFFIMFGNKSIQFEDDWINWLIKSQLIVNLTTISGKNYIITKRKFSKLQWKKENILKNKGDYKTWITQD